MKMQDDSGLSDLLQGSESRLCTGFGFTEGPVWVASDSALVFSDTPGNRMHRWRPGQIEAEVYREPSGWSNGLTLDADGNVLVCEHGGRRVSRHPYAYPNRDSTVAEGGNDIALNSPNDLVVHSSGAIFFTDPTYGTDCWAALMLDRIRKWVRDAGSYRGDHEAAWALMRDPIPPASRRTSSLLSHASLKR